MKIKQADQSITLIDKITPDIISTKKIEITDEKTLTQATSQLSMLNKYMDALTADREKLTKPLNEALKEIRAKYSPTEKQLEEAIKYLRTGLSAYQTLLMKKEEEVKSKIADRVEKGTLKLETGIKKLEALPTAPQTVATIAGSLTFRATKVLKITDISLIPREYFLVDEAMILFALKEGKTIPGAEIEVVQVPVNKR